MAKDPAFLFYPGDWNNGTMGMNFEEKGAYLELLIMQFNRGHMTELMIARMIGQLWDNVKCKFVQDDQGLWYNERLEEEQNKRKLYSNSRRNNKLGKNQYTKNKELGDGHMTKHMIGHMENENINININKGIEEKKEKEINAVGNLDETFLCYNIEEYLNTNQAQFEAICISTRKSAQVAKDELMRCHLHLEKNGKYPMQKKSAVAWFKSWLLNSEDFNAKYRVAPKKASEPPKKHIDEIIKKYQ